MFLLYFSFWDVMLVCAEYSVCDYFVCCVNVGDGLSVGNDVFYFIGVCCPVGFTVVGV